MNIEQLQLVARNETSNVILNLLVHSKTISNETNVDSFWLFLKNKGYNLNSDNYHNFFKQLVDAGVGVFEENIFIWKYSFQDVSEQILHPNKIVNIRFAQNPKEKEKEMKLEQTMETPAKRKPGRPKGSS